MQLIAVHGIKYACEGARQWGRTPDKACFCLLRAFSKVRSQEKGVLAKGVSVESSAMAKEEKIPKDIGVHFAKTLSKNPLCWFLRKPLNS